MTYEEAGLNVHEKLFESLKKEISVLDPVAFAENHLTIDNKPFNMTDSGWKFMADVYRDVAAQATAPEAKPMVILKGRQVGATILAAVLSLYFTASGLYGTTPSKPPIRVLHAFPTLGIMSKYSKDKLASMIAKSQDGFVSSRSAYNDPELRRVTPEDTLTEKTFVGSNKLRVDSVGRDADRLRGLSQDVLLFDEVQDMNQGAIENALRVLTTAQYGPPTKGVQLYFGTPKQAGSYFWDLWQASDQRYYQLKCVECEHFFFLYTIGNDDWKDIWIEGHTVKCPECGLKQHKKAAIEGGKWVPTNPGPQKFIGYHMNVLLNPIFTKEAVMDYDPEENPTRSMRAWQNETLGNFFSTSNMTISLEDLKAMCLNPERTLAKRVREDAISPLGEPVASKTYCMGIDWGDKIEDEEDNRGQSFTVIVILSLDKNTGTFTVENAWKLPKNDFQYKVEVIQHLFRMFQIKMCVADYMWGADVVNHMQTVLNYGTRFLGCHNSGNVGSMLTYKPKELRVTVHKDMMLDDIFSMFRKAKIKFPARGDSYDRIMWLLEHCASMEVTIAKRYGSPVKKYIKGIGPNDGLMALMYAMIAHRFLATSGFKGVATPKRGGGRPLPVTAYVPGV
jgi:hypothetical protein